MRIRARLKQALLNFLRELLVILRLLTVDRWQPVAIQEPNASLVMDNKLLYGKNVLITGAGRNIGRSIVLEMAKQGANIFFTDVDPQRCAALEKELAEYLIKSKGFVSDISKTQDIDSLLNNLVSNEITIDILVNNAGILFETAFNKNLDLEEWHKIFETNVFGPLYLTKLISQMMIDKNIPGAIMFITSIHQWSIIGYPSYSSSKATLGMIIKELALDLARYQIRVNGIAPGWIAEDEQGIPLPQKHAPLYNTSINPHYVGRAAVYLASDYFSKFTTGTVLKIDAGLSLHSYLSLL